jgi:hypothetical protein
LALFNIIGVSSGGKVEARSVPAQIPKQQIEKPLTKSIPNDKKSETKSNLPSKEITNNQNLEIEKVLENTKNIAEILSIEDQYKLINDKWADILLKAKEYNHLLTAILTGAKLDLKNGEIFLVVTTTFHKKRLDSVQTKKILLKIISEITGESIDFQCIILKENSNNDSAVNNEKIVEEIFN